MTAVFELIPAAGNPTNSELLRYFRILNGNTGNFSSVTTTGNISTAFTIVNSTSATTQTLPSASEVIGRIYTVKNSSTGLVTVSPQGSQTIDGKSAAHLWKHNCIMLMSDGSNWLVLSLLSAAY